ncbi:lipoprotein-releasing ABC transporter ATP-binding protein LolD [Opitutaceae bacterium]
MSTSPSHQVPLLVLESVGKVYTGEIETRALANISFSVRPGEFLAIVGSSGSGKTTLLNLLGLLDTPSEGGITLDGLDMTRLEPDDAARMRSERLGFIFQFHYLLPEFTALENALMPCRVAGGDRAEREEPRMRALLARVGLGEKLAKRPHQLSGGEQQRVAIARALANDPVLVLADEPTGNLDSRNAAEVFSLLRALTREAGKAVIMVTHDHELAQRADRIITLKDGHIESDVPGPEKS